MFSDTQHFRDITVAEEMIVAQNKMKQNHLPSLQRM